MTALEPGFALIFAVAVFQGGPPPSPLTATREGALLIADLKVVPEPKAEQKPADPPQAVATDPRPARTVPPAVPSAVPPETPARPPRRAEQAHCYDDLLDFSLGDSDSATRRRIENQDCGQASGK